MIREIREFREFREVREEAYCTALPLLNFLKFLNFPNNINAPQQTTDYHPTQQTLSPKMAKPTAKGRPLSLNPLSLLGSLGRLGLGSCCVLAVLAECFVFVGEFREVRELFSVVLGIFADTYI